MLFLRLKGLQILPRSVFKSSPTPLTVCPGTSLREASRGLNCWWERRDLDTPCEDSQTPVITA